MTCDQNSCQNNPQYVSGDSETFDDSQSMDVRLNYGSGYLSGYEFRDTVWVQNLEIPDQELAEVIEQDEGSTTNFSCLIGLGFPELAPNGELMLFDNMMQQGVLAENLFTVYYYNDNIHSDIIFGGLSREYYEGDINYVNVQERYHWNIRIDDFLVNGESIDACPNGCQGLVDTGTLLNTYEPDQYDSIRERMPDVVDWEDLSNFPTLTYVIGGIDYTLEPQDYVIRPCHETCKSGFFKMAVFEDPQSPAMVIGVVFMKKFFTVFDRTDDSNPRVGFALASDISADGDLNSDVDNIPINGDGYTSFGCVA